jgi:hypothetical protein
MSNRIPKPDRYEWEFETTDNVGVWYLEGWQGYPDEDLEAVSQHYRERGSRDDIDGTVAVFGDETQLPRDTQEYMAEEWSKNGAYTGVDRIAFVDDGITAMAVKSKIDIPSAEVEAFDEVAAAVEWAQQA